MNFLKTTPLYAAMLAIALAGCTADNDDDIVADDTAPAATASSDMPPAGTSDTGNDGVITVANADDGGAYLTDSAGNSLYMLEEDPDGTACVGDCLATWPPVLVTDVQPSVGLGSNLDGTLLGTVERPDGTLQLTYSGRPLYRYAADTGANRMAGHGLEDQWGHWYLVDATGREFDAGTTADASMVGDGADGMGDSAVAEDATSDGGPADTSATELDDVDE